MMQFSFRWKHLPQISIHGFFFIIPFKKIQHADQLSKTVLCYAVCGTVTNHDNVKWQFGYVWRLGGQYLCRWIQASNIHIHHCQMIVYRNKPKPTPDYLINQAFCSEQYSSVSQCQQTWGKQIAKTLCPKTVHESRLSRCQKQHNIYMDAHCL